MIPWQMRFIKSLQIEVKTNILQIKKEFRSARVAYYAHTSKQDQTNFPFHGAKNG